MNQIGYPSMQECHFLRRFLWVCPGLLIVINVAACKADKTIPTALNSTKQNFENGDQSSTTPDHVDPNSDFIIARPMNKEEGYYLEIRDLDQGNKVREIKLNRRLTTICNSFFDSRNNLYIVGVDSKQDLLLIKVKNDTHEELELPMGDLFPVCSAAGGQLFVAYRIYAEEGSTSNLYVINQDLSYKAYTWQEPALDGEYSGIKDIIVNGHVVILYYAIDKKIDDQSLLFGKRINLQTDEIVDFELPLGEDPMASPENSLLFISGLSTDLDTVVYCGSSGGLTAYSVKREKILATSPGCCLNVRSQAYEGYLAYEADREGKAEAVILSMKDLKPLFDLEDVVGVNPRQGMFQRYYSNWLLTTCCRIMLISNEGEIIRSFDIPDEIKQQPFRTLVPMG
jgi:hypothetical protein